MELATPDQPAAKVFYASLFGWSADDTLIGPSAFYTTFRLRDRAVAAARALGPDERGSNVPPHWTLYVAVESADEAVSSTIQMGGKICAGPFDVLDAGRMAMIFDPSGAPFALWEPKRNKGIGVVREHGAFCWADLSTTDIEIASKFYTGLFGWHLAPGETGYLHIRNGEEFIGGIPGVEHREANIPPHWLLYFQTDDCAASAEKARELGANILSGPFNIENLGRFATVADPHGAVFALFQPK